MESIDNNTKYETIRWLNYSLDGKSQPLAWTFPPNAYSTSLGYFYMIPYTSYTDTILTNLSDGHHNITVYGETTFGSSISASVPFVINTQPTPTPSPNPTGILKQYFTPTPTYPQDPTPTLPPPVPTPSTAPPYTRPPHETPASEFSAYLSESASAQNYGSTVNFTVSTNGGVPPFNFTWYVDGQAQASISSPYFSLDSPPVGSHHVSVQAEYASGNSATTLTVEFNVLPNASPSGTLSPTESASVEPTQPTGQTDRGSQGMDVTALSMTIGLLALAILVGIAVFLRKRPKNEKTRRTTLVHDKL